MHIISVISTKGGEGEFTHSANLAGFCADAGLKTLLIDGDYAQPTASSYYSLRYEVPCGLFKLLMQTVDLNRPEQLISRTSIDNLDLIISNDPHEQLKTAMMHAPDGRIRLRNLLQHPLFSAYDVIVIDSQGARSFMLELVLLATVTLMKERLPYRGFGIALPPHSISVEQAVLGGLMLDNDRWDDIATIVSADRFYSRPHSVIFSATLGRVPLQHLRNGDMQEEAWERVSTAMKVLLEDWKGRLVIDDSSYMTQALLRSSVRKISVNMAIHP